MPNRIPTHNQRGSAYLLGSVRTPAALCGLWGFRPCYNRLPYHDVANTLLGQESILSVLGPLSKSHSGLVTFFKAIIDAQPWLLDPVVTEKKWDQAAYELDDLEGSGKKKLCFAVMWDDGVVRPIPPIRRALEYTKAALIAAGHEGESLAPRGTPSSNKTIANNGLILQQ